MRLVLVAVGRDREGPERALYRHYAERCRGALSLVEVVPRRPAAEVARRQAQEADLLLAARPAGAATVALDETGRALDSPTFAARLGRWQDEGRPAVAFLIGGADGLAPDVRQAADLTLALGPMTWPHLLVRGLLAEQLYRARCILDGHPYHRG